MPHSKLRERRAKPEVNMTSMIDLMSMLLLVFMASAPMLTTGMNVELPKGKTSALTGDEKAVNIAIDKQGKIYIGKENVPAKDLTARLGVLLKQNPNLSIVISGDTNARYGQVVEVMGELKAAGFARVGLKTEANSVK
ncbi:MAG: biopolymer transporter ExbD [Rickettsiales bacterium]|jgi:biopolymer transport protein TolR|nr:biopolymer transporter ExbD [Rickettsiales bacterium]